MFFSFPAISCIIFFSEKLKGVERVRGVLDNGLVGPAGLPLLPSLQVELTRYGHNHVTPVTFGHKSCQTFDFICLIFSVLGNWDHWWTYDGISGPGMIACDGQYILTFIK